MSKRIFITGAGRRLGKTLAEHFSAPGLASGGTF